MTLFAPVTYWAPASGAIPRDAPIVVPPVDDPLADDANATPLVRPKAREVFIVHLLFTPSPGA